MYTTNLPSSSIPNFELDQVFTEIKEIIDPVVMVIDSDKNTIDFFQSFLKQENCSMICANSLSDALENSKGKKINLVVSEFLLGQHSCLEIIMLLRKSFPHLPAVIMSKNEDLISEKDALSFGANYFLQKPIRPDMLHSIIENSCKQYETAN